MRPYEAEGDLDRLLAQLDAPDDPEHPDVAVTHETGWTLSAFSNGLVVWENVEEDALARHLTGVHRAEVRRLFTLVALGRTQEVESLPWASGYGG